MQLSSVIVLLGVALFLVLILYVDEAESTYAYTIRGFVADVRHQPLRFIGGLFFKKAFILKKLKLKWKLKKKFVLKKLLKKLFLGWKLGLTLKTKAILPQIFAQYWGYKEPYYWGWGGWSQYPQSKFHHHPYHPAHHYHFKLQPTLILGRKRRAVRFPDDNGSSSSSNSGSSFSSSSPSASFSGTHLHQEQQHSSSGSGAFFDENYFNEFQSIGLGQQELDMLRQLPENLQYEYKQEMQELDTAASEPREADIMEYLSVTTEFDTDHCIAKGICEVMARRNTTANRFENLLLEYYNEEPETRKDPPKGTPAYVYDYAAFLGKSRRDSRACGTYFPKCPESRQTLSTFMNEIFSSEMCDPPVPNQL